MRRKHNNRPDPALVPLGNQVLVRLLQPSERGGRVRVIAPHEQAASRALVIAVGPEVRDVRVGQLVLISRLQGLEIGGEILLKESAVLAYL